MPTGFVFTWALLMFLVHLPVGLYIGRALWLVTEDPNPNAARGWIKLATALMVIDAAFWMVAVIATGMETFR